MSAPHNSPPASQDAFWANQFVPLPPTQFPEDEFFGGVDPFVSPELLQEAANDDLKTETETGEKMEVEIIGQAEQVPSNRSQLPTVPTELNSTAEKIHADENSTSSTHAFSPTGHYCATEFVSTSLASAGQRFGPSENGTAQNSLPQDQANIESDASSYWAQFSPSNFIPGVTPIAAYPVCNDFKEKFPEESPQPETLPPLREIADTDYFFLASDCPDEAAEMPPVELVASGEINQENQRDTTAVSRLDSAPSESESSDIINMTDFLPQMPASSSSAGERLLESVESTLSDLHQSIADQVEIQSIGSPLTGPEVPAALDVEPDFEPSQNSLESAAVESTEPSMAPSDAPEKNPEADQVIHVDGDDGYDFLDLKSFDTEQATFSLGQILLDAGTSTIQIEYKNVALAIFANDVEIALP